MSGGRLNKSIKAYQSMKKNSDQVFHDALSCSLYLAVKAVAGCLGRPIVFIAGEREGDPTGQRGVTKSQHSRRGQT